MNKEEREKSRLVDRIVEEMTANKKHITDVEQLLVIMGGKNYNPHNKKALLRQYLLAYIPGFDTWSSILEEQKDE